MTKNVSVFGIYPDQLTAEDGVEALKEAGFRNTDISVLFPDNQGTKDFAHEKNTKAPEGATTGGVAGGVIGGVLGWLVGIGSLAIPGIGPFVAAGPIMGMLGGIGVGGTVGGLTGALIGAGIPEYEAKRYEGRIRRGGILLSVHCDHDDWIKRAKDILAHTGAEDISSTHEAHADYAVADKPMPRSRSNELRESERIADRPVVDGYPTTASVNAEDRAAADRAEARAIERDRLTGRVSDDTAAEERAAADRAEARAIERDRR